MGFISFLHGGETNKYIWIMWQEGMEVTPIHVFFQSLTVHRQIPKQPSFVASFIYASCLARLLLSLWTHLLDVAAST